jgi:hypothetical protein
MKKPSKSRKEFLARQSHRETVAQIKRENAAYFAKLEKENGSEKTERIYSARLEEANRLIAQQKNIAYVANLERKKLILSMSPSQPQAEATPQAQDKPPYVCPHCNGEMIYASEHGGMASQCPYCRKAIVLGGALPVTALDHKTNNESWWKKTYQNLAINTLRLAIFLLVVCIFGICIFIYESNLRDKAKLEAAKKEAQAEAQVEAQKEAEMEKVYANLDAKIKKMEDDYNATFAVNSNAIILANAASRFAVPSSINDDQQSDNDLSKLVSRWKYELSPEQKQMAANDISAHTQKHLSPQQWYDFFEAASQSQ